MKQIMICCSATLLALACTTAPEPDAHRAAGSDPEWLPESFAACRAARGEVEAPERGGRCFAYFTPRRDAAAYAACRDGGGAPRVVGPGRSVAGHSHVCTLVFLPSE